MNAEELFEIFDGKCDEFDVNHNMTPDKLPDKEWLMIAINVINDQKVRQKFMEKLGDV